MDEPLPAGLPDPTKYLLPEEKLRLVVRRYHPIVLTGAAALVIAATVIGLVILVMAGPTTQLAAVVLLAVIVSLAYFAYKWVHWSRTVLVITNRRLFQFVSLGIKKITVMPVLRQSIVFRQSPIGRRMGFGTVEIKTASGSVLYTFNWLGDAERFRDEVTDIAA
jgi:membrane protein YdbS with pleckstrin-like domain